MKKRRNLKEVNGMAVQTPKRVMTLIMKGTRKRRKNMQMKKTWMKMCLMMRKEGMTGKTGGEKKKAAEKIDIGKRKMIEMKDTGKREVIGTTGAGRTEMIEDLRRNRVATRRSL